MTLTFCFMKETTISLIEKRKLLLRELKKSARHYVASLKVDDDLDLDSRTHVSVSKILANKQIPSRIEMMDMKRSRLEERLKKEQTSMTVKKSWQRDALFSVLTSCSV